MAVNLSPVGGVAAQFFTNNGTPLTGGKLYTYSAGSTTPAATFTSSNGSTAWTNPIVLDAAGRVPGSGEIWLTDGVIYKFILKDANDVLIATYDNITGINSNSVAYTNQQEIATATAGQTVFNLGINYQPGTNSLSVFVDGVNQYGPGAQYAYTETDSNTVTFNNGLHVGALVKFTTTQQQGAGAIDASQVSYDPPFTGGVTTNVEAKLAQTASVMDFGAVNDGVTDNTSVILSAAINSGQKLLAVPANVKYDRVALLSDATFPADVVLFDLSEINDFNSAGETTKHVGIVSKDSAPNDTHWAVDSGHHAITTLNNYGTAGSASAAERKASVLWAAGQYTLGATDKRGFRGAAILQFTQDSAASHWVYQLRSLAPWLSIAGEYEEWASGRVIGGTTYVISNGNQYVSASTGTTGSTAPTWTSGTNTDGGVSWTWIDSGDRSVFGVDQYGRWLIGQGSYAAQWRHKVSATSPSGSYTFEGASTGVDKVAQLRLIPTNSSAAEVNMPFLRAEAGLGLRVMASDASTDIARFSDDGGTTLKEVTSIFTTNSSTGATPSVAGIGTLLINNGSATSITDLLDGSDGQILQLVFQNANTTLVNSSSFLLTGSVNVTPTAWSVITMLKIPTSTSNRWVELSRSIK